MQTFLPYPDYAKSAQVLDYKRLGKQRVECLQLLKALAGETRGWSNHPACKMWKGHERALVNYGLAVCREWINRGYRDTCLQKIAAYWHKFPAQSEQCPAWLGDEAFHASHRSNLLRKQSTYYHYFGWAETDTLPYVWPKGN